MRPGLFSWAASGLRSVALRAALGFRPSAVMSFFGGTPVSANLTGEYIDERNVLTVTAAWAAVNAIATDVASLPLRLMQRMPDGSVRIAREHPASRLFSRSPDGSTTPVRYWQAILGHALVRGEGFARIDWAGGYPVRTVILDPTTVEVLRDDDGDVAYRVKGQVLLKDRILHIAGLGGDGISGYSVTDLGNQTLGLSKGAESHAATYLGNGAVPGGFFTLPDKATKEKVEESRKNVREMYGGANKHSPGIMSAGSGYVRTGSNPQETQLLELRAFQILEASRLWRVAPHKLGDYSKASYATVEQVNLAHATETLRPWCESVESALDLRFLTEREFLDGYFWEFDLSAFLRADTVARSQWVRNMAGCVTIDEVRARENLPPLPDGLGKQTMVPLNTAPLASVVASAENAAKESKP